MALGLELFEALALVLVAGVHVDEAALAELLEAAAEEEEEEGGVMVSGGKSGCCAM